MSIEARTAKRFTGFCLALLISLLGLLAVAAPAAAQWDDYDSYPEGNDEAGFGARLGIGLTDDPSMFLLDLALPYYTGGGVNVGPRFQLGFADDRNMVAGLLALEYAHDFSDTLDGPLGAIRPLIGGGIGFLWLEKENRPGKNTDAGFLLNLNVGAELPLSEKFAIATVLDFDISPEDTVGENLIFTWNVVQMRFRF